MFVGIRDTLDELLNCSGLKVQVQEVLVVHVEVVGLYHR